VSADRASWPGPSGCVTAEFRRKIASGSVTSHANSSGQLSNPAVMQRHLSKDPGWSRTSTGVSSRASQNIINLIDRCIGFSHRPSSTSPSSGCFLVGRRAMDEYASSFSCAQKWPVLVSGLVGRMCLLWSAMWNIIQRQQEA
jgi:hypothetical protein